MTAAHDQVLTWTIYIDDHTTVPPELCLVRRNDRHKV